MRLSLSGSKASCPTFCQTPSVNRPGQFCIHCWRCSPTDCTISSLTTGKGKNEERYVECSQLNRKSSGSSLRQFVDGNHFQVVYSVIYTVIFCCDSRIQLLSHLHMLAAVPQSNQTQLHVCMESTALRLITGLSSGEVSVPLIYSLIRIIIIFTQPIIILTTNHVTY